MVRLGEEATKDPIENSALVAADVNASKIIAKQYKSCM